MCLAIPGKVEKLFESDGLKMAKVNFAGIKKNICLQYTPEAIEGNYVLVHVGFAISIINEEEANRTYKLLEDNDELNELEI